MRDTPKPGQLRQCSLWYLTPEQRTKAQAMLQAEFDEMQGLYGVVCGPVKFYDMDASDNRISGKPPELGARVLVAEAEVIGLMPMPAEDAGFIANLAPADLERLRKATHRAYKKTHPGSAPLRQDTIDRIIGKLGPDVAARMLH